MLAVIGLCLSWPKETRAVMGLASPVSDRLHYALPDAEPAQQGVSASTALAAFAKRSGAPIASIVPLPRKGLYAIRTFDPRDPDDMGRMWTYVAARDGRVVAQRHDSGSSASDRFVAWQYPLHSGRALRLAGRTMIAASGLMIVTLWLSGLALWLRRRSTDQLSGRRQQATAPASYFEER